VFQVATKVQCIIFLISFFCVTNSVSATEPDHFVVFPTVSLYQKILDEVSQFLQNKDVSYQPKTEGNVLAVLKDGDMVRVKPKDKEGHPDTLCYKDPSKKIQYDWIVARDWLCVEVVSSANQRAEGKTGWIHRLSVSSLADLSEKITLKFYTQDFRPFTECQPGKPAGGVGVDIVKYICNLMGTEKVICDLPLCAEQEFKDNKAEKICKDSKEGNDGNTAWRKAQESCKKNCGIFFISWSKERAEERNLPPEENMEYAVAKTEYGFFTTDKSWNYSKGTSLSDKKVGVYGPSSGTLNFLKESFRGDDFKATIICPDTETLMKALSEKKIDVAFSSKEVGEYYAKKESSEIQYAGRAHDKELIPYYIGLHKDTPKVIVAWFKNTMQTKKAEIDKLLKASGLKPVSQ